MRTSIDRRSFLKTTGIAAGMGLAGLGRFGAVAAEPALAKGAPNAEKIGWRLGCQAYSFNRFTFYEALEKNHALGLRYIEVFPRQKLSKEKPDVVTDMSMPSEIRKELKQKAADLGIKLAAFGVYRVPNDEAQCRPVFEFLKDMEIETLVSEPPLEAMEMLDKLCNEYQINLAIHNHPKPSPYWDYKTVLKACEGRSKRIGSCADTGHWMRSGIEPLEAVKALQGRIIEFHLKDLNAFGTKEAHDVPWGTGKGNLDAVLAEVYRQGFRGLFAIEYEYNWLESVPEIAQCVQYFNAAAAKLAGSGTTSGGKKAGGKKGRGKKAKGN